MAHTASVGRAHDHPVRSRAWLAAVWYTSASDSLTACQVGLRRKAMEFAQQLA